MTTERLSRKEIREPDPFVRVTSAFWAKMVGHQKVVGLGLLAAVVATVAVLLIAHFSQGRANAASAALGRALELSRRGIAGSLEPGQDERAEKFPSAKAKSEAIAKELEAVRAQFPGSDAARTALVFLGDAQFQSGNLDAAQKSYDEYLADARAGEPLRGVALQGLGYTFEAKKDLAKALNAFEKMGQEAAGDPAKAEASYERARILELQGKKQEAAEGYQKVKDDFKETQVARTAGDRLVLLAAQGVALPGPEKKPDAKAETAKASAQPAH